MKYAQTLLDLIGNTPLVKLNKITGEVKPAVLAKIEYLNPGGSVKDRIGIAMIEDAEKKGLLKPGGTIVEPTSGNTGAGLALVAAIKGYKTIFVMPEKVSMEKELVLRAYGAKVVRTPNDVPPDDPQSYYKVAEKITRETPNAFCPMQYSNSVNPQAHYLSTGPEIWRDTDGKVTHFVAGMGTGGTISGTAKYLKEQNPKIKIIGVDPEGSIYKHEFDHTTGDIHGYKIEGIGEDFIPKTVDFSVIDEIITVNDSDAFTTTRELVEQEGILVGGSSGAAVWAALSVAKDLTKDDVMVVLLPDSGKGYISKIFNEAWLKENNLL